MIVVFEYQEIERMGNYYAKTFESFDKHNILLCFYQTKT